MRETLQGVGRAATAVARADGLELHTEARAEGFRAVFGEFFWNANYCVPPKGTLAVPLLWDPLADDHMGISSKATPNCAPSISPTCRQLSRRNESGLKDGSPRLSM